MGQSMGRLGAAWIGLLAMIAGMAALLGLAGCAAFGLAASALPGSVSAKYARLAGESVAVMVYADDATLIDWPEMRLDIAAGVQEKLQQAQKGEARELQKTNFPFQAASVVRYQHEHPAVQSEPIVSVAPRLGGITRLVYIEMEGIQTRSSSAIELFRGRVQARIKVLEISNGAATVAFEDDVMALFPPKAPEEGVLGSNDYAIYRGTVNEFTAAIAKLFFSHPSDEG